jgi:uncharacterized repeat protein (TIGR03803 family)
MHREGQFPNSVFRTISLVAIAALMIAAVAIPAFTQNSVPPTAVQAAKMPQYASRLAHPAKRLLPPETSAMRRAKARRGPLDNSDIYDNGPINGNTDAWTINFGFIVSDSFTITNDQTSITGMSFGAWLFPGDTLTSVEVSITSSENGGTSYFDQTVNFTQGSCNSTNGFGFNVCTETGSFSGLTLNAGTYWVNLQNASVPSGDPVYWDENSGVGCTGQGCPSQASENTIGSIPSEAFTILGNATTTTTTTSIDNPPCPSLQNGFYDIHNFDPGTTPSGVAVGPVGKLYGALANAGNQGVGLLYDLAHSGASWFFRSLYSFVGGANGSGPNSVIVGPGGALFGAAESEIQTCGPYASGNYSCGLIYKATPGPSACASALCGWNETTIYQFTGNTDAWDGTVSAFDSAGNLYGTSYWGEGSPGNGALFELSPMPGGWTETILHSFTGGSDGAHPTSLLMGQDGNLYGTASAGGTYGSGVVFQFVPSSGGWTENVIYAFTGGSSDGLAPSGLIQGGPGMFYGVAFCWSGYPYDGCIDQGTESAGVIWSLSQSGDSWDFDQLHVYHGSECYVSNLGGYQALALGTGGELYATEGAGLTFFCSGILDVQRDRVVVYGPLSMFTNLTSDADGNLYGTSPTCGPANDAMVWQLSP